MTISNTLFVNNTAQEGGGAIFWDMLEPVMLSVNFTDNNATYGDDLATPSNGISA